ncbi:snaclec salmorin subunit A [Folsomia candida]|uniref:snaclec salmorin subunit A n=1 Tax=Folsomia candida TaxID=158441 RepID=UPI000B8F1D8F|nr:snaclec salmorin subunit A [Folsomia candida]
MAKISWTLVLICLSSLVHSGNFQTPDLIPIGGVNGKLYFMAMNELTWGQAKTYCTSGGMKLPEILTPTEQAYLKANVVNVGNVDWTHFWIGATDAVRSTDNLFWTSTNATVSDSDHAAKWQFSGPNTCVAFRKAHIAHPAEDGAWVTLSCAERNRFLCEYLACPPK